jgi:7-cyano-7-deazaguanine synthase
MDSAVCLAEAMAESFEVHALSFDYGQRHDVELAASKLVARAGAAVSHRVVQLDLRSLGGSALTDSIDVPMSRSEDEIGEGIPVTYVPARNTVFLSIALGWAEVLGARDIYIGVNALDYSGYPDCRREFLEAFERLAGVATAAGAEEEARFRVRAPLLELSKADIVRRANELGVDLGLTHTCYSPELIDGVVHSCGACDACSLRLRGFAEAGETDPLPYLPAPKNR